MKNKMKFRIYDTKTKKMLTNGQLFSLDCSNELPFLPLIAGHYDSGSFPDYKEHDYHLMISLDLSDHKGNEVYTGDIIQLDMTDELFHSGFEHSYAGQAAKKHDADTLLCIISPDLVHGHLVADSYMMKDGSFIMDKDGDEVKVFGRGYDSLFIEYILGKKAFVAGNVYQNEKLVPDNKEK